MNMLQEHIREYINPYPSRYTRGKWEIRVLPHDDLDDEGVEKYWRMFKKFPNDFAEQSTMSIMITILHSSMS